MAQRASSHERRAMEAEREVVDLYRALFMRDHIGDEYDGTVAAATTFGLFVQIEKPFVEGLIKLDRIGDDFYELDKETMRLVGRRSGHAFALGDPVRVRVEDASIQRRQIDLALVSSATTKTTAPPLAYDQDYSYAPAPPPNFSRPKRKLKHCTRTAPSTTKGAGRAAKGGGKPKSGGRGSQGQGGHGKGKGKGGGKKRK